MKKRNRKRAFIIAVAAVFLLLLIRAVMPTWTPRIRGERSISEYETVEALQHPVTEIVSEMEIPVYFVMGRYDGMTSPEAAAEYLKEIGGDGEREFVLFEDSAHYPQLEEADAFAAWMRERFGRGRGTGCFVSEGRDF